MTDVKKETITQTLANKLVTQTENNKTKPGCVWDTKEAGFGIRIGNTSASFIFKYRNKCGKSQTKTFGKITDMSVAEARDMLCEFKPTIKNETSTTKKYINKLTVRDLCNKYLNEHQTRETTRKVDRSRINRLVLPIIADIPLCSLTAKDMMDLQNAIANGDKRIVINGIKDPKNYHSYTKVTGGKGAAKRTMEMMKTMLNFAEDLELIQENPMNSRKFKKIKVTKQETAFLEPNGYEKLGFALKQHELSTDNESQQSVLIIKLLALTGCRKSELLGLTWDRVNLNGQYFTFAQTKTTEQQIRVFGSAAKKLLEQMLKNKTKSKYIFPSKSKKDDHRKDCLKALNTICKNANLESGGLIGKKLTLHGLRHSFATRCNDLGFSDVQIEGLLGHKKGDVEGIYAHNRSQTLIQKANEVSENIYALLQAGADQAND